MEEEIVKEFLIESYEILNTLDNDLVALERESADPELLNRIFRGVHTIKGTSGFLSFTKLVSIAHVGEGLLDRLRKGALAPSEAITSALLSLIDAIRAILTSIEATGTEGDADYAALAARLEALQDGEAAPAAPAAPDEATAEEEAPAEEAPAPAEASPRPDVSASAEGLSAAAQTLRALQQLHQAEGQPVDLTALAAARGLAEGTIRNHLTALNKDGAIEMTGEGTYLPAAPLGAPAPEPAASEPAVSEAAAPASRQETPPAAPKQAALEKPAPQPSGDGAPVKTSSLADNTIRVDVELLDALMNLVGELVLTRNQILQHAGAQEDSAFTASSQHLNLITTELQEGVMKTRMQPIKNVWNKFPRVVRDVAVACHKEARVEMEGAETELDKTIIEAIKDPLTHLVRNAVDHGIERPATRAEQGKPEEGTLLLRAFHEGGQVNIEIIDDGGGIDPERIRQKALERGIVTANDLSRMSDREVLGLIFLPGFSTTEAVSDISGRGVGMDVVKTNIEKIGGTVDVHSTLGEGTTFKIKIPLTLAIIPALIVRAQGDRFAIPQVNLLELVRLEGEQVRAGIERIYNTPVYRLRGQLLPLVYLDEQLELAGEAPADEEEGESADSLQDLETVSIVVLQAEDQHFGLVVDEVIDTEEVVVKPLSKQLKQVGAFAGATIMGDGKVALILDVLGLADRAHVLSDDLAARAQAEADAAEKAHDGQSLLLLRAGDERRLAVPLEKVARLEEVAPENVERAGRREVVQYRGRLMPLVRLGAQLGDRSSASAAAAGGPLPVVVCSVDGVQVGLVVREILDVVEERLELERLDASAGVEGVAVIQERVTEVLDVEALVASAGLQAAPAAALPA